MMRSAVFWMLILQPLIGFSQEHNRSGFYFALGAGAAVGNIQAQGDSTITFKNPSFAMHVRLGWSLKKNLLLHLSYDAKTMKPELNGKRNSHYERLDEVLRGAGLTYYFKNNISLNSNVGLGKFIITDKTTGDRYDTHNGFSMNFMIGKEWWVSDRHAVGIGLDYGFTRLDKSDNLSGWRTQRFSLCVIFSNTRH